VFFSSHSPPPFPFAVTFICTATRCNTRQHAATHCNTLHYTATHFKTVQHTATHYNTLHRTATHCSKRSIAATHCNTLQHTATHYNTLQHTATHCRLPISSSMQIREYYIFVCCHTHLCCNTLQHYVDYRCQQRPKKVKI